MQKRIIYNFQRLNKTIQLTLSLSVILSINISCRTTIKPESQAKPKINNLKLIIEADGAIHWIKNEPHKIIIQNGTYFANDGILIDLDTKLSQPINITNKERDDFRGMYTIEEFNKINSNQKIKIEAIGSKSTYKIYNFGNGPDPFAASSRLVASFTGELRLVRHGLNREDIIVSQKVKNFGYTYPGIGPGDFLADRWERKFGFTSDYKYMYYLDKEPGETGFPMRGKGFAYFIEL